MVKLKGGSGRGGVAATGAEMSEELIEASPLWMAAGRMMAMALLFFVAGEALRARVSNSAATLASSLIFMRDEACLSCLDAGVFGRGRGWTRTPPTAAVTVEGSLPQISTMPETFFLVVAEGEEASNGVAAEK